MLAKHSLTRPIPGLEGYYKISTDGVVTSVPRYIETIEGVIQHIKGRILKVSSKGKVQLVTLSIQQKRHTITIPTLLKLTFPDLFEPVKDLEGEIWMPTEYKNFVVSNKGRLKRLSFKREAGGLTFIEPEKIINGSTTNNGSMTWTLSAFATGLDNQVTVSAGKTIYEAFHGPYGSTKRLIFLDGNNANYNLENLHLPLGN